MYKRPAFKAHLSVKTVHPDLVLVRRETGCDVFEGALLVLLADLLDGNHTLTQIVAGLDGQATAIDVQFGLSFLDEHGLLADAIDTEMDSQAVFAGSLNLPPEQVRKRLRQAAVSVTTIGGIPREPLIATLESLGIKAADSGSLEIVLTDDYLADALQIINRRAFDKGTPWLLTKPVGTVLWIGPLFRSASPCWQCLAKRLRENRMASGFLELRHPGSAPRMPKLGSLPASMQTAVGMAATEVWKWIAHDGQSDLEGAIITFDTRTLVSRRHTVVRQPECGICGDSLRVAGNPVSIKLESRRKRFTVDGGHRMEPPETTFERFRHHISPITGVVDRFENYAIGLDQWLHVYVAEHLSTPEEELRISANRKMRRPSAGKGMTEAQARMSALSEALERYSGFYRGDERIITASYHSLGMEAIHPDNCQNFSNEQFRDRSRWNSLHSRMHWVPEPFDEAAEIDWCEAWSLSEKRRKYVPAGYCYYRYPVRDREFFRGNSNGCAAGSCLEEAIVQGFLELVERDCTSIWWYNRIRRPGVNLDSFEHPYFRSIEQRYRELSRDLWVLDITNDLEIPTFAAISKPSSSDGQDSIMGFGTHFDPVIAVARAITEVNQFLPHTIAGGFPSYNWEEAGYSFLHPDIAQQTKQATDYSYTRNEDLLDDMTACVERARSLGMEMIVLDQTRADIGLSVVRVIVPGLRHVWARFGPGRLYEVPLKLSWLHEQRSEEDFDRVCFFP